jgi:GT2 family glycosyltransferase
MSVAIVVLTHNRVDLLRACVENVLGRTSPETSEIVIWNNASTDATHEYLDSLNDPRMRVIHHSRNIGQNAYAEAFGLTNAPFLIELDDDVIDAPDAWDKSLLDAFLTLPDVGYLATDLAPNPDDRATRDRYEVHRYRSTEVNGIRLLDGPTGGWCAITSRELYDLVGGMPQEKRKSYFLEDAAYINRIGQHGFSRAILDDLHVLHAGGSLEAEPLPEKVAFFARERKLQARKDAVKRVLLAVPTVGRLNDRYGWFERPDARL